VCAASVSDVELAMQWFSVYISDVELAMQWFSVCISDVELAMQWFSVCISDVELAMQWFSVCISDVELAMQMTETEVQRERELRSQLARQAAAHSDHVKEVLRVRQHELRTAFDVRLASLVDRERAVLQQKVAGWTGRMLGIDKALAGLLLILYFICRLE